MRDSAFDLPVGLGETRPVSRLSYPDGSVGWLVTGHELAQRVLTDRRFSSRMELISSPVRRETSPPAPAGMFLYHDGSAHARYRRLVTGQFTVRRTRQLAERIERIVTEALDQMESPRLAGGPGARVRDARSVAGDL